MRALCYNSDQVITTRIDDTLLLNLSMWMHCIRMGKPTGERLGVRHVTGAEPSAAWHNLGLPLKLPTNIGGFIEITSRVRHVF